MRIAGGWPPDVIMMSLRVPFDAHLPVIPRLRRPKFRPGRRMRKSRFLADIARFFC